MYVKFVRRNTNTFLPNTCWRLKRYMRVNVCRVGYSLKDLTLQQTFDGYLGSYGPGYIRPNNRQRPGIG